MMPKYRRSLRKPAVRAQVKALILEGLSERAIAERVGVDHASIQRFKARHAVELAGMVAEVERHIEDAAISHKVNRILAADDEHTRLGQVIEARAADKRYDEPGYATGMMVHEIKSVGAGESATLVDQYKVDTAVVAERRALRRAVAEELAQLPRPNVDVNVAVGVTVVYVEGGKDE